MYYYVTRVLEILMTVRVYPEGFFVKDIVNSYDCVSQKILTSFNTQLVIQQGNEFPCAPLPFIKSVFSYQYTSYACSEEIYLNDCRIGKKDKCIAVHHSIKGKHCSSNKKYSKSM